MEDDIDDLFVQTKREPVEDEDSSLQEPQGFQDDFADEFGDGAGPGEGAQADEESDSDDEEEEKKPKRRAPKRRKLSEPIVKMRPLVKADRLKLLQMYHGIAFVQLCYLRQCNSCCDDPDLQQMLIDRVPARLLERIALLNGMSIDSPQKREKESREVIKALMSEMFMWCRCRPVQPGHIGDPNLYSINNRISSLCSDGSTESFINCVRRQVRLALDTGLASQYDFVLILRCSLRLIGDPIIQLMFIALCRGLFVPARLVMAIDLPSHTGLTALKAAQFLNTLNKSQPDSSMRFAPKSSRSMLRQCLNKCTLTPKVMFELGTPDTDDKAWTTSSCFWSLRTEDQPEIDRRRAKLTAKDEQGLCGWLFLLHSPLD